MARIESLEHVLKNSPQVLPGTLRQLKGGVAQVSSGEMTASQTSPMYGDPEDIYEEIFIGDEVNICVNEQQSEKVCQLINKIKVHY